MSASEDARSQQLSDRNIIFSPKSHIAEGAVRASERILYILYVYKNAWHERNSPECARHEINAGRGRLTATLKMVACHIIKDKLLLYPNLRLLLMTYVYICCDRLCEKLEKFPLQPKCVTAAASSQATVSPNRPPWPPNSLLLWIPTHLSALVLWAACCWCVYDFWWCAALFYLLSVLGARSLGSQTAMRATPHFFNFTLLLPDLHNRWLICDWSLASPAGDLAVRARVTELWFPRGIYKYLVIQILLWNDIITSFWYKLLSIKSIPVIQMQSKKDLNKLNI